VKPLDRRAFLAGGAAATLAPVAARARRPRSDIDVAIIGGGVAGTYAAWRLRQAAPHLRVMLFEMNSRIGGRLRSVSFPQAPHLVADVGGMRFLEVQKHVAGAVRQLDLAARPFPVAGVNNRLALRGKSFSYAEAGVGQNLFTYNVASADQSPHSDLFVRALSRIVPDIGQMTPAKWKAVRSTYRYKGRLLKDWAAWTLLSDAFTAEEMRLVQDAGGYDDFILYENGLEEFDFIFLGDDESRPFQSIVGGYQRLPEALAAAAQWAGAVIQRSARLTRLHLPTHRGSSFQLGVVGSDGKRTALEAKSVVLALPRRAMELIDDFPALREPGVYDLVSAAVAVPACKTLTLYPRPWWKDQGITGGRSITDLPARQFYALGAEPERLPAESGDGFGVLMTYAAANTVEYWRELAPASADAGFQWLAGDSELAQEIHREATLVYATAPPEPLAACFQDWSADPFGGGWHFWAKGRDGLALADRIIRPIDGVDLFICGESYTPHESGWVEGAIERAETMLQRHFGLKAPAWLV
jgi:monoamine oxidase